MKHPRVGLLAVAMASALPIGTADAQRVFPVEAKPVVDDRLPPASTRFANGVTLWRDIAYQTIPGYRPQIVDIYVPPTPGPHPLVVYVHGGGWKVGHTRHSGAFADFPAVLAGLAAEGFTVASVEYRLSGEVRFPAPLQDVNAAIRFLRAHAATYAIDPARVGIWGGSAGGHLSALVGVTCRDTTLDPASAGDGCVQAVSTWYGVYDLRIMPPNPQNTGTWRELLGCKDACTAAQLASASSDAYVKRDDPPFLLIHGEEDKTVPVGQSHAGEATLKAAGVPVKAIYLPGVDHSFIGKTLDATRNATLRATKATFDFFHRTLGVPAR